jgi:hypothetical protein
MNMRLRMMMPVLAGLRNELEQKLSLREQLDWLTASQADGAPQEYRNLVNEYFERLSREAAGNR